MNKKRAYQENKSDNEKSFEEEYRRLMKNAPDKSIVSTEWTKNGDMFKKFSLYDESKYETSFSSSLN